MEGARVVEESNVDGSLDRQAQALKSVQRSGEDLTTNAVSEHVADLNFAGSESESPFEYAESHSATSSESHSATSSAERVKVKLADQKTRSSGNQETVNNDTHEVEVEVEVEDQLSENQTKEMLASTKDCDDCEAAHSQAHTLSLPIYMKGLLQADKAQCLYELGEYSSAVHECDSAVRLNDRQVCDSVLAQY